MTFSIVLCVPDFGMNWLSLTAASVGCQLFFLPFVWRYARSQTVLTRQKWCSCTCTADKLLSKAQLQISFSTSRNFPAVCMNAKAIVGAPQPKAEKKEEAQTVGTEKDKKIA